MLHWFCIYSKRALFRTYVAVGLVVARRLVQVAGVLKADPEQDHKTRTQVSCSGSNLSASRDMVTDAFFFYANASDLYVWL